MLMASKWKIIFFICLAAAVVVVVKGFVKSFTINIFFNFAPLQRMTGEVRSSSGITRAPIIHLWNGKSLTLNNCERARLEPFSCNRYPPLSYIFTVSKTCACCESTRVMFDYLLVDGMPHWDVFWEKVNLVEHKLLPGRSLTSALIRFG